MGQIGKSNLRCPACGGRCGRGEFHVRGVPIAGWTCRKCGYQVVHPKDVETAYRLLRARRRTRVRISRRGNSLMITLPKAVVDALGIRPKGWAEVSAQDARTIIVKVKPP